MRDYLAWRLALGVTTPSTNTVVQPEYDDMRSPGVTNHLGRMRIRDISIASDEDFAESIRLIDAALEEAVAGVISAGRTPSRSASRPSPYGAARPNGART